METFLVGGAVRDDLLGLPVGERDWVVVGATPAELERAGYRQVGRDFPVFLHPESREEYALARIERKTAPGYRGFTVHAAPDVTLEDDLKRRDLTINAIARDAAGRLRDPYGGQADLERRLLRHVSDAFAEDPVRILRVARFAARFAPLGFTVAPETEALMRRMVEAGEAGALVPERVWAETAKALKERTPSVYFAVLDRCGALRVVYPELDGLRGSAGRWAEACAALDRAAALGRPERVRLAAFLAFSDDPALVEALCTRTRVPTDYRDLAVATTRWRRALPDRGGDAGALLALLEALDAFRRADRYAEWLAALEATGADPATIGRLARAREVAAAVVLAPEERGQLSGPQIGAQIRSLRLSALGTLAAG